jgi:hypothetical protein
MTGPGDQDHADDGGEEDRGVHLARVRGELADLAREAHALATGDDGPGADIVPARSTDPIVAKQQLAALRAHASRHQKLVKDKRDEFEALMLAELAAADAALRPMRVMVTRLEDAIGTVNLYLGRGEEIVLLRDGASAPDVCPGVCRTL